MNKINNKGFMMAEIIVVAVVIVIALVGLFTTFTKTFIEYERYNEYSQVDSLYASKSVINTLYSDIDSAKKALEDDSVNFKEYTVTTNIELEPLFNKYNIKSFYLVKYGDEGFNSLISSLTNNEELKRYVNYLKNNLNLTDGSCEVISILEMQSDFSSGKSQFGYYKFVKNSTSGGGAGGGGVSEPDLSTGLIPIKYVEETGKWKVTTKDDPDWYNYDEQKWANAALIKSGVITESEPEPELKIPDDNTIFESTSDVLAMFVWIPRFSYTIGCHATDNCYGYRLNDISDKDSGEPTVSFPGAIDIKFISKDYPNEMYTGNSPTYQYSIDENGMPQEGREPINWYTHPAFTFGGEQLSGIWVGKFETSVASNNNCYTGLNGKQSYAKDWCVSTQSYVMPRILPNVLSLVQQNVYNQFETAKKFTSDSVYGLDANKMDSHMMKNSEWSAVAYLSQSIYGKYGNNNFIGGNKEIYVNDSWKDGWSRYTGRSYGQLPSGSMYSTNKGRYQYDGTATAYSVGDNCSLCGTGASTTGNIYGIYDMNGGAAERVMGNYNGINTKYYSGIDNSWFSDDNNKKYYDKFTITKPYEQKTNETIGYAFVETKNWYNDLTGTTFSNTFSWVARSGKAYDYEENGVFYLRYNEGSNAQDHSFRTVLVSK